MNFMFLNIANLKDCAIKLVFALALSLLTSAAGAFPTWIGVYGSHQRHSGSVPGQFTVLMNQDYSGLYADVQIQVNNNSPVRFRMNRVGNVDGNSHWTYTPSITMPAGATVKYSFIGYDKFGGVIYDNNGGANYSFKVPSSPALQWAGNDYHWPFNNAIKGGDTVWVNVETYPISSAKTVRVVYSVNNGTWQSKYLVFADRNGNNEWWSTSIGKYPTGGTIKYAIEVVGFDGRVIWLNNGGNNYTVKAQ